MLWAKPQPVRFLRPCRSTTCVMGIISSESSCSRSKNLRRRRRRHFVFPFIRRCLLFRSGNIIFLRPDWLRHKWFFFTSKRSFHCYWGLFGVHGLIRRFSYPIHWHDWVQFLGATIYITEASSEIRPCRWMGWSMSKSVSSVIVVETSFLIQTTSIW